MGFTSNVYIRSAVEVLHDIAAGAFPGAVLAAWMIRGRVDAMSPDAGAVVGKASLSLWLILMGALFVVGVTGPIRLSYWRLNARAGSLEAKKRRVLIKHTAFVLLWIGAVALAVTVLPG